jgi:hypothetical protein
MRKLIYFIATLGVTTFLLVNNNKLLAQTWEPTNGPYGGSISCFAESETYLYAGTGGGVFGKGIFRSADHGANWTAVNTGLSSISNGKQINALTVSGSYIIASTGAGVYISANQGDTWALCNYESAYNPVVFLNLGNKLLAGGYSGLYVSTDNGLSWSPQNDNFEGISLPSTPDIRSLIINGTTLYAGTYKKGIFSSTDNGETWRAVNDGLGTALQLNVRTFGSLCVYGNDVFVGTSGQGVFRLIDNNTTWTQEVTGLPSGIARIIISLLIKDNFIYVSTPIGIYKSANSSTISWSHQTTIPSDLSIGQLFPSGSDIFASSNKGIHISADNLATWAPLENGIMGLNVLNIKSAGGTDILASTQTFGAGFSYKTSDLGDSWIKSNIAGEPYHFNNYNFTVVDVGLLHRSTNNGDTWELIYDFGTLVRLESVENTLFAKITCCELLFYSTDNGESWTPANGVYSQILSITKNDVALFAATHSQGILKSMDNGINWTECNISNSLPIRAMVANETYIFAGTSNYYEQPEINAIGIYRSSDNGTNWELANNGLGNLDITSLVLIGTDLYAGTKSGIYKSVNSGDSWISFNEGFSISPNVTSLHVSGNYLFTNNYVPSTGHPVFRRALSGSTPEQPSEITGSEAPCAGSLQVYSVVNVPNVNYVWQFPAGWVVNSGSNTNEVTVTVGTASGAALVTPSNVWGNGPAQVLMITTNPVLYSDVSIASSSSQMCEGTEVTVTATPNNGGNNPSYQWYVNGLAVGMNESSYTFVPQNSDEVHVVMTSNANCILGSPSSSNAVSLVVEEFPTVTWEGFNPGEICVNGDAIALTGGNPEGGIYSGTGVSGNVFSPTIAGTGEHTITYTYASSLGCSNEASITLTVSECVGVSTYNLNSKVSLYPNPASREVKVNLHEGSKMISNIKVLTPLGVIMLQTTMYISNNEAFFSVDHLTNGVYMVQVTLEGGEVATKVLVVKK